LQKWNELVISKLGLAEILVDGELVVKGTNFDKEPEKFDLRLSEGNHDLIIRYYYRQIQNQLNIMYKTEDMTEYGPFENLVLNLNE